MFKYLGSFLILFLDPSNILPVAFQQHTYLGVLDIGVLDLCIGSHSQVFRDPNR